MSLVTLESLIANVAVQDFSVLSMFKDATWTVRAVLFLLTLASVISVAIIIKKWFIIGNAIKHGAAFLDEFDRSHDLKMFHPFALKSPSSPYRALFLAAYVESQRLKESGKQTSGPVFEECLQRVMRKAQSENITEFEDRMVFLATTGATAPFIGLFGTVWGIMNAFYNIGLTGASSLAIVAPGISEALIATAVGLFAAIPAVIFYNFFTRKIRKMNGQMIEFRDDLVNRFKLSTQN